LLDAVRTLLRRAGDRKALQQVICYQIRIDPFFDGFGDIKTVHELLYTFNLTLGHGFHSKAEIVVRPIGHPRAHATARERAIVVSDVASDSGGGNKPLITRQAIQTGLSWVATRLLSQLDVTYSRPEALIPPKQMEVDVTRKDVKLWAPRWGKE